MTVSPANLDAALPVGMDLAGSTIEAVVAASDSGFVYRATDPVLQRKIAIKEYFPVALAVRRGGTQMQPRSAADHAAVAAGRQAFLEESRLLSRIEHPALAPVLAAFEINQTAYRVLPWYSGPTLEQARRERADPPGDEWLLLLLTDLLEPLQALHAQGAVHGRLHPSQVMLREDDRPVLLGSAAAANSLRAVADEEFAPPELTPRGAHLPRGPWTDLYGLAALAWFAATGSPAREGSVNTPAAVRSALDEAFGPAATGQQETDREAMARAIAAALEPAPAERPQRVEDFRVLLGVQSPAEPEAERPSAGADEPSQAAETDPAVRAAIAAAVAAFPDLPPPPAAPVRAPQPGAEARPGGAAASKAPAREASAREASAREASAREASAREASAREASPREAPAREASSREASAREASAREAPAREAPAREAEDWTATRLEAAAPSKRKPALKRRTSAAPWALAAAVFVGAVFGAAAWQWNEWRAGRPGAAIATPKTDPAAVPERNAQAPSVAPPVATGPLVSTRPLTAPDDRAGDPSALSSMAEMPSALQGAAPPAAGRPQGVPPELPDVARTDGAGAAPPVPAAPVPAAPSAQQEPGATTSATAVQPAPAAAPTRTQQAATATQQQAATATQATQAEPPPQAAREQRRAQQPDTPTTTAPTRTAELAPARREAAPAAPAPAAPAAKAEPPKAARAEPPKSAPLTLPPRSTNSRPAQKPNAAGSKRVTSAPPKPDTPREACGSRTNFSLLWCMQAQCRLPAFTSHPQCRELRRTGDVP